jgi:predicted chitinase
MSKLLPQYNTIDKAKEYLKYGGILGQRALNFVVGEYAETYAQTTLPFLEGLTGADLTDAKQYFQSVVDAAAIEAEALVTAQNELNVFATQDELINAKKAMTDKVAEAYMDKIMSTGATPELINEGLNYYKDKLNALKTMKSQGIPRDIFGYEEEQIQNNIDKLEKLSLENPVQEKNSSLMDFFISPAAASSDVPKGKTVYQNIPKKFTLGTYNLGVREGRFDFVKAGTFFETKEERAAFMAQLYVESGGKLVPENLNYSEKSVAMFGKARAQGIPYSELARNPELLANTVYGGKWGAENLGNTEPGDGWKYRGRGYIQITGRANYERYGKMLNIDLVNNPDLALKPDIAKAIAVAYWKDKVQGKVTDFSDTKAITKVINGGDHGLAQRIKAYNIYINK